MRTLVFSLFALCCATSATAIELTQSDAGIYTVLSTELQPTGIQFRFTRTKDKWTESQRSGDGRWNDIQCGKECEYRVLTPRQSVQIQFPTTTTTSPRESDIACIRNGQKAFCKYRNNFKPPQQGSIDVFFLVLDPDKTKGAPVYVRLQP